MDPQTIARLPEIIGAYLEGKLPEGGTIAISNVLRCAKGGSRAMWSFDAAFSRGAPLPPKLAIRADESTCFREPEITLEKEFRVYKALERTDVPVIANYWYEPDPRWIGQPFVIREWKDSVRAVFGDEMPVEQKRVVLDSFIEVLAAQHMLDWQALGLGWLGVPANASDCAMRILDIWESVVKREQLEPYPLMTAAMSWLRRNVPSQADRIVLNQGQVGPGQFLFRDDRVVASLDWESAYIGDPMSDIAYFAMQVRPHVGDYTDELLQRYSQLTGIPIRADSVRFYTVFHVYWGGHACLVAINKFVNHQSPSIHTAWLGMGGRPPAAGGPPRTFARGLARLLSEA
jgi:aminoglycoside phosphotransferase (APT) family kinase protein